MSKERGPERGEAAQIPAAGLFSEPLPWRVLILLIVLCSLGVGSIRAEEIIGVNETNLGWLPRQDRNQILRNMATSEVRSIRLVLTAPFNESMQAIQDANAAGLSVLLNVNLNFPPFFPTDVTGTRVGTNVVWPLSRFNAVYFEGVWREVWKQLQAAGVQLAGLEFGNEINWAAFNGDLGQAGHAALGTTGHLDDLPEQTQFVAGLRNYVAGLQVLRRVREEGGPLHDVPIVSAGLATVTPEFARSAGLQFINPEETLAKLRAFGADFEVDGYGIHFYSSRSSSVSASADPTREAIDFCSSHGATRSCWVTEWGVQNIVGPCPTFDPMQVSTVSSVRGSLDALAVQNRLKAAYFFNWSLVSDYAVWRCGRVTPAGLAGLARPGLATETNRSVPLH